MTTSFKLMDGVPPHDLNVSAAFKEGEYTAAAIIGSIVSSFLAAAAVAVVSQGCTFELGLSRNNSPRRPGNMEMVGVASSKDDSGGGGDSPSCSMDSYRVRPNHLLNIPGCDGLETTSF